MNTFVHAARPLVNDLFSSLLFAGLLAAGVDVVAATLIAMATGVAHLLLWLALRKPLALPDRLIAFFGAGLVLTPYAMNYELALFAPAVAAYLMRREDRLWPVYVLLAAAHYRLPWTFASVLPVLLLPAAGYLSRRLEAGWTARPAIRSTPFKS